MVLSNQTASNISSVTSEDYRIVSNDCLFSEDCCYQVQAFLGEGTFGQVARCIEMDTNMKVAIKIIKQEHYHTVQTEVDVLKVLSAEDTEKYNFVKWYECFVYRGHTCLVFELLELSLFDFMKQSKFSPMPVHNIRPIVQQVATALNKLKILGLMHTDLKPENIVLVDQVREPFRIKLIDFGSAGHESNARRGMYIQSRWYRAPEVILGLPFSHPIDVWSLGCVAAGLLMGYPMYPADSEYELMRYITQTQGQLPDKTLSAGAKTRDFFVEGSDWSFTLWRLKTPEEYEEENCYRSRETRRYILSSLDQLREFKLPSNPELTEVQNRNEFLDLLKKMLNLEEGKRITSIQVLEHPFIDLSNLSSSLNLPWTPTKPHPTKQPWLCQPATSMVPRQAQPSDPVQADHVGQCSLEVPNKKGAVVGLLTTEAEGNNQPSDEVNVTPCVSTHSDLVRPSPILIPEVKDSKVVFTLVQEVKVTEDLTTEPHLVVDREIPSTTSLIQDVNETNALTTVPSLKVERETQSETCLILEVKAETQEVEAASCCIGIKEVQPTEVEVQKILEVENTPSLLQADNVRRAAKASSSLKEEVEIVFLSLGVIEMEAVEASSPSPLLSHLKASPSLLQGTDALPNQEGSTSLNLLQGVEETKALLSHLLEVEAVGNETSKSLQDITDTEDSPSVSQETNVPPTLMREPKSSSDLPEQVHKFEVKTRFPFAKPKNWKICRCLSRLWRLVKQRKNKKSEVADKDAH